MSEPIVFVSHFRIKEGKLDAFRQHTKETSLLLEADKPRTSAFLPYASDDGRVTIVHVFADADAMDAHVQGADERSEAVYEFIDPDGWEIYGRPSADVLQMLNRGATASGVHLVIQPDSIGGFLRLS
jgi:quinol monooxygenase YgiN